MKLGKKRDRQTKHALALVAFAVVFWLLSAGGAYAAEWTSVRTSNFVVIGEVAEPEVRLVAARLEQFRDTFSRLFPKLKFDDQTPTNVLIFRDQASYRAYRPKRPDGSPDEGVAGYFLAGEAVNYITLAMRGGKSDPYHTIFHEYMHFLLKANTGKTELPAWLAEGLAQYYETIRINADETAVIGEPPQGRLGLLRRSAFLPWKEFFSAGRTDIHGTADRSRSLFYAQSWLLVHYLMHKGPDASADRLDSLIEILKNGGSAEATLKEVFKTNIADLNAALRIYVETSPLPATTSRISGRQITAADGAAEKVTAPLANALLGDLLLHLGRPDEAERHLRSAVNADKNLLFGHASLGNLLVRSNRGAEAVKHLELVIEKGSPTYLDHFNYAFALSRTAGSGGMVSLFPEPLAGKMRNSLRKAIALQPAHAESYRLLAFMNFVNGHDTDEAASLLERGLAIKPGNEHYEILLARVMLKQERFDEARRLADKLSREAKDAEIRRDAMEVLSSVTQFVKTRLEISIAASVVPLSWSPSLVLLKRSWVDEKDVALIERNRYLANLNRLLERPKPGEERILGSLERIDCVRGSIVYNTRSGDADVRFTGERFTDLRLAVLIQGSKTFQIDCGVKMPDSPAVLSYVQGRSGPPKLTSITFVPVDFELWSSERLAAARQVVVEDDLLKRINGMPDGIGRETISIDQRWRSIAASLKPAASDEKKIPGTLEEVECSETGFTAVASINGAQRRLRTDPGLVPTWFSATASQVQLACGAKPRQANVLFTVRSGDGVSDGERLSAIEFVPEGFPFELVSAPGR